MVAAGITTLLLLGMTGIFDQAMKAWRLSSRRADAEREVRAALTMMQRDLKGMVVSSNFPIKFNVIDAQQVSIPGNPDMPARAGLEGADWTDVSGVLFFASAQRPPSATPGDVAGIGYYVAWDPTANGGLGAYNLYRRYQSPADLLRGVSNRISTGLGPYEVNTIPEAEIVAANVLNFWAYMANITTNAVPEDVIPWRGIEQGTNLFTKPSYVQLELTAYGGEAVRGFTNRTDWGNTNNVRKFGRSFIWRVSL